MLTFRQTAYHEATRANQERFQQKLAFLAGVISQLDPDVVALQEIGSSVAGLPNAIMATEAQNLPF